MTQFYSRAQIAVLLGVSVQTVIALEKREELQSVRLGRRAVRIPAQSVEQYLARRRDEQFRLSVSGTAAARVLPQAGPDAGGERTGMGDTNE